jgi:hypothetical protein
MAKVTGPLLSLDASGSVASAMTFSRWKGINYVRQRVIPTYSNTTAQANVRKIVHDGSIAWKAGSTVGGVSINSAYKLAYNEKASGMAMSGFNLFIKECVQKNDGASYDGSLSIPTQPGDVA